MKIDIISTNCKSGGAGIAAFRLCEALHQSEHDVRQIVLKGKNESQCCLDLNLSEKEINKLKRETYVRNYGIKNSRTSLSNTPFTIPFEGIHEFDTSVFSDTDIINLHWVAGFLSSEAIRKIAELRKPVVWTFHDEWAYTGGCHYTSACEKFKTDCMQCPQLIPSIQNIPGYALKEKSEIWASIPIEIVTPSRWLAGRVKESRIFKESNVHVIPNSLNVEIYKPLDKKEIRRTKNISDDQIVILFGSQDGNEKRKGFEYLLSAMESIHRTDNDGKLANRLTILTFGKASAQLNTLPYAKVHLGNLTAESDIVSAYNMADIYVIPSLEDNLPNTILEAMSCGIPTLAFNVGGIPDIISNNQNGLLVELKNIDELANKILLLVNDDVLRGKLSKNARKDIIEKYSPTMQSKAYSDLFEKIQNSGKNIIVPPSHGARSLLPISDEESYKILKEESLGYAINILEKNIDDLKELMIQRKESSIRLNYWNTELKKEKETLKSEIETLKSEIETLRQLNNRKIIRAQICIMIDKKTDWANPMMEINSSLEENEFCQYFVRGSSNEMFDELVWLPAKGVHIKLKLEKCEYQISGKWKELDIKTFEHNGIQEGDWIDFWRMNPKISGIRPESEFSELRFTGRWELIPLWVIGDELHKLKKLHESKFK